MMSMQLMTASISQKGGRDTNEDYCEFIVHKGYYCWVVADGLGGHTAGEVASKTAVKGLIEAFKNDPSIMPEAISGYVEGANRCLLAAIQDNPHYTAMMTTIVFAISDGELATWGHVGDSRLYVFREGRVLHQTKDHSFVQAMVDRGEITPSEARVHKYRNWLLSALGGREDYKFTIFKDKVIRLLSGDALLLCTDGLWEHLTEVEMLSDLAKSKTPEQWLNYMVLRLKARALEGHDNYTAIAVICY